MKLMDINTWEKWYEKILNDLGFSRECDEYCAEILNKILKKNDGLSRDELYQLIHEKKNTDKAIVFGGLEPFDSFDDMLELVYCIREKTSCDIVIYTGYDKDEIINKVKMLSGFGNIIVKFGRYIPDDTPHYDDLLGITLSSSNQYAEEIL